MAVRPGEPPPLPLVSFRAFAQCAGPEKGSPYPRTAGRRPDAESSGRRLSCALRPHVCRETVCGAAFVLIYLFFLLIFGLPILAMEFAVGRASQKSIARSFDVLEPKGTKWHWYKYIGIGGNYLLMMFYTTIGGWMLLYFVKMLAGEFEGLDTKGVGAVFSSMQADPVQMTIGMVIVVLVSFGVCSMGLQKGVEKITKVMMVCLLIIMVFLAVRSVTLPGAGAHCVCAGIHFPVLAAAAGAAVPGAVLSAPGALSAFRAHFVRPFLASLSPVSRRKPEKAAASHLSRPRSSAPRRKQPPASCTARGTFSLRRLVLLSRKS